MGRERLRLRGEEGVWGEWGGWGRVGVEVGGETGRLMLNKALFPP